MFLHFLRHPQSTGAICSSSHSLAKAMIADIDFQKSNFIAEIGPGLGVFTKEILKNKTNKTLFFALEINADLVKKLQKKFPQVKFYHQGAEDILEILKQEKIAYLDAIVSGLPWSVFTSKQQDRLLEQIYNALKEGGKFSTFAYIFPTPQAKKFRKKLFTRFSNVRISKIVWKNLPPACVYYCEK